MAERAGLSAESKRTAASSEEGNAGEPLLATTRRDFLKFVVAGSTLVVGGSFIPREMVLAQEGPDIFDVGDFLILAEEPYASNLVLEVTAHNRIRFELPRLDKGQGIVTAMAMMIAELMDADYDRTDVVLSDARADRPYSLTGYSSTIRAMWSYVPPLAGEARARLVTAAGTRWGLDPTTLTTKNSMVFAPDGRAANYGELSAEAAAVIVPGVSSDPKPVSQFTLVGTPKPRKNAREIVTGAQKYTLDIDLPGAAYAVVARPPDIKGTVVSYDASAALAIPGVVGVVEIPQNAGGLASGVTGGVAVAADSYKTAFDARDALVINWAPGPLATTSDGDLRTVLQTAATPLLPALPGTTSIDSSFEYPYMAHAPLEVQTAAAHVDTTANTAEVWFASQSPLYAAQLVAAATGVAEADVTLHVTPCGGSFGRHLFAEAPVEAAVVSQALGVPIKLMFSRNDDMRHGRFRPMAHHDLRASWDALGNFDYQHNVSAAETDFRHGLGDAITASGFDMGSNTVGQSVFEASVVVPYDFAQKSQQLVETILDVPTCSWRSIYSGYTTTSNEIFIDEIARARGEDEVQFRLDHLTSDTAKACLQQVAAAADWSGATLPAGHAYGVASHVEYRSAVAYLVQIDASDPQNPRLVNAWVAADLGVPINPRGAEAQLQGVLIDGFTTMFRAGNHLDSGTIREGSYGDFLWARMNHAPVDTVVHIFPAASGDPAPGGCGELGLPPASAACVNAYARATGTVHHQFPIGEFL